MAETRLFSILTKTIYGILTLAGIWIFFRFLLGWLLPFMIAMLIARLIEPAVAKLVSFKLPRFLASGLITLVVVGAISGLIALLTTRAVYEIAALLKQLPEIMSALPEWGSNIQTATNKMIAAAPVELQEFLSASASKIITEGISIPSVIYEKLIGLISGTASALPNILLFIAALTLGLYFTSSEYPVVSRFIVRQFPEKWRSRVIETKKHLMTTMGKWLRAQITLMMITFIMLSIGFSIMGIKFSVLLAALVALIDALPVFGTGTVLIPWALWSFLCLDYRSGVSLTVIYCVISVVRTFMEPKLVGRQLGLSPLVSLMCIYVGYSAAGIIGMILAPIAMMMAKQFNDWGYIKLFK